MATWRWARSLTAAAFTVPLVLGPGQAVVHAAERASAPPVPQAHAVKGVTNLKPKTLTAAGKPMAAFHPTGTTWPAAASRSVTLPAPAAGLSRGSRTNIPGTPIWAQSISGSSPGQVPKSVTVRVAPRGSATAAGVSGVVFTLGTDTSGNGGRLAVGLNYSSFGQIYGGNYASRLHLVRLPACSLTTPQRADCRQQTPLPTTRDRGTSTLSATVDFPSDAGQHSSGAAGTSQTPQATTAVAPMVLAATSSDPTDGGDAGTYGATPLKPSGSWSAGGSTGSFTYDYEIPVANASSTLKPTVGLSYDSGSVDGQTSSTEAQASWVGDGWSTPDSYIERTYASCADSPEGSASPVSTYDRCYDGEILTLSLNGNSTSLVYNGKTYTPADDNGEKIAHFTDTGNGSGTYNTDYWTVTDRNGITYTFGRNELPGWSSGKPTTHSVDYEPVYSAHSTDPCYSSAGFTSSVCTMAYKWHLDYVTDSHGNAMSYYYKQDTNYYGQDKGATRSPYVRDSYLDHIDHGFRDGDAYGTVPDKVVFTSASRCVLATCDPLSATTAATEYPDVPDDLVCTSSGTCNAYAPSYFSTVRLTSIATQQYSTASSKYLPVDTYNLVESTPATGDGTSPTLWLNSITHTGNDSTAGGSTSDVPLPPVTFKGTDLPNRVDNTNFPSLYRWRLTSITTEMGEVIGITYDTPDACTAAYVAAATPSTNTRSCYPVYWTPKDYSAPVLDWFDKYAVKQVLESDTTGGAQTKRTDYTYTGGAAWHYDDNEVVKAKYRTYGQFRGFATVTTLAGDIANDPQTKSATTYYRGMGGTITDSQGGSHTDSNQLAGNALETTAYKGDGGPVDHSTITSYWVSPAVATRARDGLPDLTANVIQPAETWTQQALTDGGTTSWRYTEKDITYDGTATDDNFGLPLYSYTHTVPVQAAYDQCATTTYAPANTAKNIVGLVASQETDSVACAGFTEGSPATAPNGLNTLTAPTSVSRPDQVESATRTYYDDTNFSTTFPQTTSPSTGYVTMVQQASDYTSGAFVWQTTKRETHDIYGRQADSYDANGNKTSIAYTVNSVGLTTGGTVTNAKGQSTSTVDDPPRGLVLAATDINGVVTTSHYDALGRVTAVWTDSRATSSPANTTYTYTVSNSGLSGSTANTLNDSLGYATSVTVYDSLGRVRQTQQPTPQGGRLITESFFDSRGLVRKKNNPYWDPSTTPTLALASAQDSKIPNQDDYTYDGLGRAVIDDSEQYSVTKQTTTTIYNGDTTTVIPPTGGTIKTTVTDPLGRTSALRSYTAAPTVTTPSNTFTGTWYTTGGAYHTTSYGYDGHGQQSTVTDASSTWTSVHDLLGRVTSQTDPDSGTTSTAYDPNGNVRQTTDARGDTVSYAYDVLNRKTGQYAAAADAQSASNELASWVYDNDNAVASVPDPLGHVTTATSYTGGNAYVTQSLGYNVFGESLGETVTIPSAAQGTALGKSWTFKHSYTTNTGLLNIDTYPVGGGLPSEPVAHTYATALDLPNGLADTSYGYAQGTTYDAYTRPVQETLGMGSNEAYITNQYDPHTGNLTDQLISRTTATPAKVDDQSYTYDPAGNLTRQTSTRLDSPTTTSETQCFTYDGLDRLTTAWTATDTCQKTPTATDSTTVGDLLGTTSAYWTSWTFTAAGQRYTQTQHSTDGSTADTVTTYGHDGNGKNQPHTLTSDTTTGGTTGSDSYTYDAAGNMLTRNTAATGDQALTWDQAGRLSAITTASAGVSYIYDADGNLLIKADATSKTLYLPDEEVTLDTTTSAVTGVRYYALPGGGTAVRTGTGTNYDFEISDPHGSGTLLLDYTAQTPTWRQFTPYGAPRGTTTRWLDDRGFLNAPTDTTTGLTSIGAREYDPSTGAFISLDPLLETSDPSQLNGYDYAGDNPVTHSDPTGLMRDGSDGSGDGPEVYGGTATGTGMSSIPVFTEVSPGVVVQGSDKLLHELGEDWAAEYRKHYEGSAHKLTLQQDDDLWSAVCSHNKGLCQPDVVVALRFARSVMNNPDLGGPPSILMFAECEFSPSGCGKQFGSGVISAGNVRAVHSGGKAPSEFAIADYEPQTSSFELGVISGCNSFAAKTQVEMADGSSRRIDSVKRGDEIDNALPGAKLGSVERKDRVTDVHVTRTDRDYVDVTVETNDGDQVITGTAHHLYWDVTSRSWVRANQLRVGDALQTRSGHTVRIAELRRYAASIVTYNLTVQTVHTYYVLAGNTPVLVHNGCDEEDDYLYRGVPYGHPKYQDALEGSAVPLGGHSDPARHAGGNTDSDMTSWTHDYEGVALDAAEEFGVEKGIVLRIRRAEIPDGVEDIQIHGTDLETYEEMEHALRGTVDGAEISIGRGPWKFPEGPDEGR